jgi:hypothetical protein
MVCPCMNKEMKVTQVKMNINCMPANSFQRIQTIRKSELHRDSLVGAEMYRTLQTKE